MIHPLYLLVISDIFVERGMEDVEDGVVGGLPRHIGQGDGDGVIDVAEVARATEGRLHVDRPLGVVVNGEEEDDEADVAWCTIEGDQAGGKSAGLRGDDGA
jgi:hypothetical protein